MVREDAGENVRYCPRGLTRFKGMKRYPRTAALITSAVTNNWTNQLRRFLWRSSVSSSNSSKSKCSLALRWSVINKSYSVISGAEIKSSSVENPSWVNAGKASAKWALAWINQMVNRTKNALRIFRRVFFMDSFQLRLQRAKLRRVVREVNQ